MREKPFIVLMAEDNEHDIIAVEEAWEHFNIVNPLFIVNNGSECLDYLYRRGEFSDPEKSPRPNLVLLDIKMPKVDGLTVLKTIRNDQKLKRIPVVILTTSRQEEDKIRSYDLGVNAYICKPVQFENLSNAIKTINLFWEMVEFPGE
ncbi:response regulator [candidate division KSB1 bacterium]